MFWWASGVGMISLLERGFVQEAVREGVRVDGRSVDVYRPVALVPGTAYGHFTACIGRTKVVSVVKAEVVRPFADRPLEGQFGVHVELSQMAVSVETFCSGTLVEDTQLKLQRLLERLYKNGRVVDMESLCIVPGEQVREWQGG